MKQKDWESKNFPTNTTKNNTPEPIFEIKEKESMPLYMAFGGIEVIEPLPLGFMDVMITIQHKIKTNEIEVKGRIRYEKTGRKTILPEYKMPYTKENLKNTIENMNDFIDNFQKGLETDLPGLKTIITKKKTELNFKEGATEEEIIKIMTDSNEFNITTKQTK